jgi:type III secretion system YscQ/HrcQ family protein
LSRETKVLNPYPSEAARAATPPELVADSDVFSSLPRLALAQVRLERRLARWHEGGRLPRALGWLEEGIGGEILLERPEIRWRASGLERPSLVAQFTAPRLATRLAMGVEIPLAHTVVDRLLGFDRAFAETRLQLSPVEWGVWSFLILRSLDSLGAAAGALNEAHGSGAIGLFSPGDLMLDRVSPDRFDPAGLGSIVTIRWGVRMGGLTGAVRLWLAQSLVEQWLSSPFVPQSGARTIRALPLAELSSTWRAEAGLVHAAGGLRRLRVGSVLPFTDNRLAGSPRSPTGPVDLVLDLNDQNVRCRISARPVAETGVRLLCIEAELKLEPLPRVPTAWARIEKVPMSQTPVAPNPPAAGAGALDVPVTLVVELGRVNLTLTQLADLKPGDVVELGRNSRAPVELTSNGRLVARGELVLIDSDLGVRVTNVFL